MVKRLNKIESPNINVLVEIEICNFLFMFKLSRKVQHAGLKAKSKWDRTEFGNWSKKLICWI